MQEEIIVRYEKFGYKGGPCIEYDEERSEMLESPCYRVRDISEIKAHLQVRVARFDALIEDNNALYYLLPCMRRFYREPVKDGTIVSVRWKIDGKVHIKGLYGKTFVVPIITMMMKGNPICVRFYKKKIHTTGKISAKTNLRLLAICQEHLTRCNEFWEAIQSESDLFVDAVEWLADICRRNGDAFINHQFGDEIDYRLIFVSTCPREYQYFITKILDTFTDVSTVLELYARSDALLRIAAPASIAGAKLQGVATCQMRYIYRIGLTLNVPDFVQYLYDAGYFITYYDDSRKNPVIKILDRKEYDDDDLISRKNEDYVQTISFSKNGTIQHSGTGHQRHEETYKKLMNDIIFYYHSLCP